MRTLLLRCARLFSSCALVLMLSTASQAADEPPLRGRVVEAATGHGIPQAEVVLVGTPHRTFTDDDGRFELPGVAPGAYTLSVLRLGFRPLRQPITLPRDPGGALLLRLEASPVALDQITVTPGSFSFMSGGASVRQTLSREEVEAVPQIGGDIFRAVNRLPGLSSNDYAAHFGIRGGRYDETLILLDGMELYEPYHLKDFNDGAISIIDASTIDGVELMTGGFPARYGDKRSGVFDIRSRTPEEERTHVDVNVSMLNSRLMARGRFAGERGAWLASGRVGYQGLLFQFIDQADLPRPEYEDVFGKLTYRFSARHWLDVDVLHAGDRYTYDIAATTGFLDTIPTREAARTRYGNSYLWATLQSSLGAHTTVRTRASGALVTRSREGSERALQLTAPFYSISNDRRFTIAGLAQDWSASVSERDLFQFGFDLRAERNRDTYRAVVYQDPDDPEPPPPGVYPIVTSPRVEKSGTRAAAYVSNRWRPLDPFVLEAGARWDRATWTGDNDVSPRVSAALRLSPAMNVRLGWGLYRQTQGIDDVAALNGPARWYRSERSDQWTAGWDYGGDAGRWRIETYWKRGDRLRPVYRNWKGAIDAFPEPNEDRILVFPREQNSRGVEVYFDRPIGRRLTARASYAYSIIDEDVLRIENVNGTDLLAYDLSHPGPQDQRHAANADLTWRSGRWTVNGSFAYHTGWPATLEHLVPVINDNGDPDVAVRPVKLYAARLPDYLRLDLRLSRGWPTRWGDFAASLEVINATNHTNVFGYDYFRYRDGGQVVLGRGDETWFTIFPSLGLSWSTSF